MPSPGKQVLELERVAIRFAGDSGDGMQLTGTKFTEATALAGNDLSTFPDFPAEIRAPAGSLAGVSGFQVHFAASDVRTPADHPDVLVALNPAALRANLDDLRPGAMVIINSDAFSTKNLERAGYAEDPMPAVRERYHVIDVPLTTLNREAVKDLKLGTREADRSKNFFALGLMYWLYGRPMESTLRWLESKFKGEVLEANIRVLKAGWHFGETTEAFPVSYVVPRAKIEPGIYRNITGNAALAWGIVAAGQQLGRPIFLGAYPITPASDVLHELARYRYFGVKTFQAEDEIAAISAAIGAAFAGHLAICTTSGPGFVLKQEALGLAVMAELPLVVVDIQRAGPSTGMPTKTEQADLLLALFGRNSDSPVAVLAPSTPGDCFHVMIEAFTLAVRYMAPVVVLSDGYLANSSEPWRIPDPAELPQHTVVYRTDPAGFRPYLRDPETLARPWAIPGTPGLEHRIGGLEKEDGTGNVSYLPRNHARMIELRSEKIARIARDLPPAEPHGADRGRLLIVGWGGTHGAIIEAVDQARAAGKDVASLHLRHLNPFAPNLGEVLRRFEHVVVAELNQGQLCRLLRAEFLVDAQSLSKVSGQPFHVEEILHRIDAVLGEEELTVAEAAQVSRKEFVSDQDVRWCPGCGDYSILSNVQKVMPELGVARENVVFVSGIGCSSRFPYYMNTYGFHTIHGRAPAFATGIKVTRPELSVWVVTGDGDGLSIGGNHLLHTIRRNVDLQILLFNNRVYGLTKGQYSPTSRVGMRTKSSPQGAIDHPIDPISFALGAGATFVARSIDVDATHLQETLHRAHAHKGTAFVEILQNCPVYNDNEWVEVEDRKTRAEAALVLADGEPLVFGAKGARKGIRIVDGVPSLVLLADDADPLAAGVAIHREGHESPAYAFALASLTRPDFPLPIGVFRAVGKPTYEALLQAQVDDAVAARGPGDLAALLHSGDTWTVE